MEIQGFSNVPWLPSQGFWSTAARVTAKSQWSPFVKAHGPTTIRYTPVAEHTGYGTCWTSVRSRWERHTGFGLALSDSGWALRSSGEGLGKWHGILNWILSASGDNLVIGYLKFYLREGRPEFPLVRITHVDKGGKERFYVGERHLSLSCSLCGLGVALFTNYL